ncbi:MAG: tRNA 2-thiouridine(34) synthase MnmA [Bacteroidales bacterium]|nr:tRNA 2-thiouridine(34) synthase MnmA [Bacteroidales bacterium]
MKEKKKVLVGLSGGVDSSVAAYLLKKEGYDVVGVTMAIWDGKYSASGKHACYGPDEDEEIREAREIAEMLEIPYHVFDCAAEYKESVLNYFKAEYLSGRTPNPCVKCNQLIKFGMLPLLAEKGGLSYDYFATGHYAKVSYDATNKRYLLKKGLDPKKDQTYFIHRLSQEQLSKILLPLGGLSKPEVREIAREAGIPSVEKEESQDFYGGDYKELLEMPPTPGNIVMADGKVVGTHNGFWNFTIGQRKGLGVAYSEPLYVVKLNPDTNEVLVGTRQETFESTFVVKDMNWISVEKLTAPMEVGCKIRSAQKEREATIEPGEEDTVRVTFYHPNDAITPGQSAVFYDGEVVVGGGTIV